MITCSGDREKFFQTVLNQGQSSAKAKIAMTTSDFTDEEDRQLVQMAKIFTDKGEKVRWIVVENKMKQSKKRRYILSESLKTLKKKYGKNLNHFPTRFTGTQTRFGRPCLPRSCTSATISVETMLASKSLLLLASDARHFTPTHEEVCGVPQAGVEAGGAGSVVDKSEIIGIAVTGAKMHGTEVTMYHTGRPTP